MQGQICMYEKCPECQTLNEVVTETWYHGQINYFICTGCDVLFGQAPDGTYAESRYYYEELEQGYNPYNGAKPKRLR